MSLLNIQNLNIEYATTQGNFKAVKDFCLTVNEGEIVSLVGESGSGKSSVALAIGQLLNKGQVRYEGSICFEDKDVMEFDVNQLREYRKHAIAYIFQEPAASLNPVLTVQQQIAENLEYSSQGQITKLLEAVQIREPLRVARAYPHELSGGMQQRAMIAMALAKKPQLLIADEPTTALDATVQKDILKLLLSLKKTQNLTLLFITHDLNVAQAISNRILVMQKGSLVEEISSPKELNLKNAYAKQLFSNALLNQEPKTPLEDYA